MPVPGFLGVDIPRWRDDDEGAGASSPSFLTRVPSLRVERAIGSGMDYLDSKRIISDASTEARVREVYACARGGLKCSSLRRERRVLGQLD